MAAGYSTNPLFKKLGLKEGSHVRFINAPPHYGQLLGAVADSLNYDAALGDLDFVHFFTNSHEELQKLLPLLKQQIRKDGTIWVSWYKKSSGKATEVTENMIRDIALCAGLVDVKVCAIDEEWSGLKLVFRLKDR